MGKDPIHLNRMEALDLLETLWDVHNTAIDSRRLAMAVEVLKHIELIELRLFSGEA